MIKRDFAELSTNQQVTLLLAMHIRNELEIFHVRHISDLFMPELNSTIRYAIFDFFENVMPSEAQVTWLARMLPDYWEIPGIDPQPVFGDNETTR